MPVARHRGAARRGRSVQQVEEQHAGGVRMLETQKIGVRDRVMGIAVVAVGECSCCRLNRQTTGKGQHVITGQHAAGVVLRIRHGAHHTR